MLTCVPHLFERSEEVPPGGVLGPLLFWGQPNEVSAALRLQVSAVVETALDAAEDDGQGPGEQPRVLVRTWRGGGHGSESVTGPGDQQDWF